MCQSGQPWGWANPGQWRARHRMGSRPEAYFSWMWGKWKQYGEPAWTVTNFCHIIYCKIHTLYIIISIIYIKSQNQLTIQHWLSLLQASTRSGWKRKYLKLIWFSPRKKLIVYLEERFKCLPGVLKTPGQVLSPSGKEEHPVQDQGKLGQHRQCGVSGKITKIAPLDHLRKWSTLCKHSVNILDLIKIYE